MSDFKRCPNCGYIVFSWQAHTCPPRWWCRLHDDDEEQTIVFADTAQEAAERYVSQRDTASAGFSNVTIVEASDDAGNGKLFEVEGRLEPAYYARDITGKAAKI